MKRLLFLPLIVLLLAACSQRHDNFVLEGSFKGFSQGELYIYGVNGAWPLDTIGVAKGKFRYAVPITEPTAFVIVFPPPTSCRPRLPAPRRTRPSPPSAAKPPR